MRNLLCVSVSVLGLAGCFIDVPDPEPAPTRPAALVPDDRDQSRFLLGPYLDDLAGADATHKYAVGTSGRTATNSPVTVTFVAPASLRAVGADGVVHTGADKWFNDLRLPGPGTGELKLRVVASVADVTTYTVEHRASSTAPWTDACAGDTAVVLTGSYSSTWTHEATPGKLTLACGTGVVKKCTDWKYPAGATPGSAAWDLHQACTRLASDDVCGQGAPQTRTGTFVQVHDRVGINLPAPATWPAPTTWPPNHDAQFLEAGWSPSGAVCQSRSRWQSVPPGPMCGGALRDPRQDASVHFCDSRSTTEMAALGAILWNTTRYNDIRLDTWVKGNDRVQTVRGYNKGVSDDFPATPAFSGYSVVPTTDVGFVVRSLTSQYAQADVAQVTMFENAAGDHVLGLTSAPPAGYTPVVDSPTEGWVLTAPGAGRQALKIFVNPTTGDRTTGTTAPAGYQEHSTLGYTLIER